MALKPISGVRQRDHMNGPADMRSIIERASVFSMILEKSATGHTLNAGDHAVGTLLYDAEFLGAWWDQDADEGTNGTAIVEKWDDVSGSGSQTSISASLTVDAGAQSMEWMAPVSDGEEVVTAGYKINVITTGIDGSPTGRVTCWFKLVDDLGEDG
jgi:hypothetical protein